MYCKMFVKKKLFWVKKISLLRSVQKNFKKEVILVIEPSTTTSPALHFSQILEHNVRSLELSPSLSFFLLIGWLSGNSGNGASAS